MYRVNANFLIFKLKKITPVPFKIEHLGCEIDKVIKKNPHKVVLCC